MNIFPFNFLFLNSRPPKASPPPKGRIRLAFDALSGAVKAINSAGQEVPFSGSSGPIEGVTDGSDAADGVVGQYLREAAAGPEIAATEINFVTLELPAGDWDVVGGVRYGATGATAGGGINAEVTSSASGFDFNSDSFIQWTAITGTQSIYMVTGPTRFSITETTSVYLRVDQGVTASSQSFYSGFLRARRVR